MARTFRGCAGVTPLGETRQALAKVAATTAAATASATAAVALRTAAATAAELLLELEGVTEKRAQACAFWR